jgi:hypothetical protein
MNIRVLLLSAAMSAFASGCYVSARPAAAVEVEYHPVYYDDWVVYYDERGLPYYHVDGRVVFVPSTDIRFHFFVRHYRDHGAGYRRWYRVEGHRRHQGGSVWQHRRPPSKRRP